LNQKNVTSCGDGIISFIICVNVTVNTTSNAAFTSVHKEVLLHNSQAQLLRTEFCDLPWSGLFSPHAIALFRDEPGDVPLVVVRSQEVKLMYLPKSSAL
jgi:hypothetical protein